MTARAMQLVMGACLLAGATVMFTTERVSAAQDVAAQAPVRARGW